MNQSTIPEFPDKDPKEKKDTWITPEFTIIEQERIQGVGDSGGDFGSLEIS
ncbi:hypothetical protein [Emticicia soli]|uniref:Paeninodin family lasso peptide n=1 Tax=Emticicia soli TaxID=2027878 RepID=A0ABW5J0X9_9BACT